MKPPRQTYQKSYPFKLKPIAAIVFTLFAQHAQAELLTLAQAEAQNKQQKQCEEKASSSRAKAMCKQNAQLQMQHAVDDAYDQAIAQKETATKQHLALAQIGDVDAALFGAEPENTSDAYGNAPFNVSPEIIRTAEATTASPLPLGEGESRQYADSNASNRINTPNTSKDSKALNKKEGIDLPIDIKTQEVKVRARRFKDIGPMPGIMLTKEQIPGNIQSISAKEIKESHSLSLSDLLNSKLQSVNVNDYQGNPFQMDVTYRGFTASPQIGSPQGLSVFFDGIRVNEPFGDVVNWDMIPMNALGGFDIFPGSNPIFGLNTLGGALSMRTKSGFTDESVSAEVLAGSFGRKQLQVSGGWNNGNFAAFGAGNFFLEDGWRDNSPSEVNQAFGKLEWQGEKLSLALSSLAVVNKLVGNGTVPQELYRQNPSAVFTSPDTTKNKLLQFQLTGIFDVNDTVNITGMVYNRKSDRISNTGDIIDYETFNNTGDTDRHVATRRANPGETITCGLTDSNRDGVPDYYVIDDADFIPFITQYQVDKTILNTYLTGGIIRENEALTPDLMQALTNRFAASPIVGLIPVDINAPSIVGGAQDFDFISLGGLGITYDDGTGAANAVKHVFAKLPVNIATCKSALIGEANTEPKFEQGALPASNPPQDRDGARDVVQGGTGSGVIKGTPTAIITKSNIAQVTQGGALQINFNFDQHKLMVGAALDRSRARYTGKQRLGQIDNNRNVFNDPSQLGEEFFAADNDITINDFDGTSLTKSLYASETWSPTQTLNFSISGRYNHSDVKNSLAPKIAEQVLTGFNLFNRFIGGAVVCPGNDLSNCPINLSKPVAANQLQYFFQRDSTNYLLPAATEKFSYQKFNPALGVTWQAKPNLNLYANWNQGTRVPSVIELGCAYDDTLVERKEPNGSSTFVPRGISEGRGCSLPSALSGDPYLPQVVAKTMEVGARGKFGDFIEWNVSAYRTNVQDDIYMTSLTPALSFFQSIGDTRRQGIEFGMAGEYGKSDFRINYSLTEAIFNSTFRLLSPNNSSRTRLGQDTGTIQVTPGNVMPGVPFNNINFNWGYKFTPKFKVNASVVAHSDSFLRGNENNAHTPNQGATVIVTNGLGVPVTQKEQDNNYAGKAPGYAVLNMNARYDFGGGWGASVLVNNVLDKTYYTAGRLGITPFAPSTLGAIGPGGFNYNSNEWIPTQFISAGAPRGIWMSLSYDFDKAKKPSVPQSTIPEPDRTLEAPSTLPTTEELALMKELDNIKTLPVLKLAQAATLTAKQEVSNSVELWRKAMLENNVEVYLGSYSTTYAPAGVSHNQWAEQQKARFISERVTSYELSGLVVVPENKRMVAIFNQALTRGEKQERLRKILTFEQKQGQWAIVSEHIMPASKTAAKPSVKQNGMLEEPPPKLRKASINKNGLYKTNLNKAKLDKAAFNQANQLNSLVAEAK